MEVATPLASVEPVVASPPADAPNPASPPPASPKAASPAPSTSVIPAEATTDSAPEAASEVVMAEPVPEVDIEALAAKKRKLAVIQDESKKRSKRMFGLLQSTLVQAKKEVVKMNVSGAAQKRIELEERLAKKLSGEKEEMEEKRRREREGKELRLTVTKKEEEIRNAETIYRTRHDAKLNLASFLCTTFTLPPPLPSTDGIGAPFAPRLPHALRLTSPTAPKPLYYLPYRLLPFQEDKIEDQIALVKKAIRREREDWDDAKGDKVDDLEKAKRKRDEGIEEMERGEREERQKRRREKEERDERAKEVEVERKEKLRLAAPAAVEGEVRDADMEGVKGGDASVTDTAESGEDAVMKEDKAVKAEEESMLAIKGAAAGVVETKADDGMGDEDLEY